MRYVADASAVVPYLLGQAADAEREVMLGDLHSPALLDVEVTQTLRGLVRGTKLDLTTAELAREDLDDLAVQRYPDTALLDRAWEMRDACTIYDGLYVALAEALEGPLITRDARLGRSVGGLVDVVVA